MSKKTNMTQSPKEVEVNVEEASTSGQQIPGYLSVKLSNLPIRENNIEFFGVTKQGETPSGQGVKAQQVKSLPKGEEAVAWFDIEELLQQRQFTDQTVECIIKVDDQELGREKFSYPSTVYLG